MVCFLKTRFLLRLSLFAAIAVLAACADTHTQQPVMATSKAKPVRIATFNLGLDHFEEKGELAAALSKADLLQARNLAAIIQAVRPDILLLQEIDGNDSGHTLNNFVSQYLEQSQQGQQPLYYEYQYQPFCNTGVDSGFDLTGNGKLGEAGDAWGFGHYPGKYCMAILSRYPIDTANSRSFAQFKWQDLPKALKPELAAQPYYSDEIWSQLRLSSKNHIDVPVLIEGERLHLLAAHPTPPVFDGPEDSNGRRNFDELRLLADYITGKATYLVDDQGRRGGLAAKQRFVIMGDLNASAVDGDARIENGVSAIEQLTLSPAVKYGFHESHQPSLIPTSEGAKANRDSAHAASHTAGWGMRADYVLPSAYGLRVVDGGVFWPNEMSAERAWVQQGDKNVSSDHRLVWLDIEIEQGESVR